ncbi:MAG: response regulator [Vicingaceae bacterium]|jgi:two-component system response regulator LytT|tara:strand:+ start:2215 stop:2961 length:747 start_codon:yes stop_codon:yes gene_type:complete
MKIKILIVEDEAIVAKDISVCLEKIGYEVLASFSKGEKALTFLEENTPDLVLMDIMLAGNISGIDASARIKKDYDIPVVFLTAYADEKTIERAKITEPYGYVIKPFKEIDLRTSIEMALYKFKKEKEKFAGVESSSFKNAPISSEYIYVKFNSKLVKVQNSNIIFVEALKDYVIIHTEKERFTIHSTMKDIEKKLPVKIFMRVHRSFILNLNKINSIDSSIVIIENSDKKIPIGGSYRESLFKRLNLA